MSSDKVLYVNPETKDVIATGNVIANGNVVATGNITAAGNVGIGTTQPLAKLHVNGLFYAPGSVVQFSTTYFTSDSASTNPTSFVKSIIFASFTPKFATSKVLVDVHVQYRYFRAANYGGLYIQLRRDGVEAITNVPDSRTMAMVYSNADATTSTSVYGSLRVSSDFLAGNTVSSEYQLYYKSPDVNTSVWVGSGQGNGRSCIQITEIAQ